MTIPLKLRWRKTWANKDNDFVAENPDGGTIGRIYIHETGGIENGRWRWFFASRSGFADTPREAAKAIEDLWFARTEPPPGHSQP